MESPNVDLEGRHRRGSANFCTLLFAWVSFLFWTIVIFLLIFGIALFAFVRSSLPEVKIHRLDINKLDVIEPKNKNKNKDAQLAIDIELMVNVTNNNKKMTLVYEGLDVETMIEGFALPKVHVNGFRQKVQRSRDLKIHPKEMRSTVNHNEAKELKSSVKQHQTVLNMKMRGKIEFWFKGTMVSKLGLKVLCSDVQQSLIDQALPPGCNVKLTFFS